MGEQFQTAGSVRYSDVDTEPEADEIFDSDSDSEYAGNGEPPSANGSPPEKRGAVEEHEGEIEDDGDVNSDDDSDASKKEVAKSGKGEPPRLSEAERSHLYDEFMKRGIDKKKNVPFLVSYNRVFCFRNGRK